MECKGHKWQRDTYSPGDLAGGSIFFQGCLQIKRGTCIEDQIWGSNSYPTMFHSDKNGELFKPINMEEVHYVLKSFTKDKCLRPSGWMVKFFLHFIDLIGPDLVQTVEES